jgi:hypothetical protein
MKGNPMKAKKSKPTTLEPIGPRMHEQTSLRWPDGQQRTRHQDRTEKKIWKRTPLQYLDLLKKEMARMKAVEFLLTRNEDDRDPGVSVFFSRKAIDNYGWQEAFGLIGVIPTEEQIAKAYHKLAAVYSPDNLVTGDPARFREITEHRDRARDWARGAQRREHEYGIACDAFTERRWNMHSITTTLSKLRQIEDLGCTVMFEQVLSAFTKKALTAGAGDGNKAA